jgi:hypothetical protein
MAGHEQVTLARGCGACIKAKRKCSRTLPRCQRCLQKKISCGYRNAPLNSGGDFTQRSTHSSSSEVDSSFDHKSRSPTSSPHYQCSPTRWNPQCRTTASVSIDWKVLKSPEVVLTIDKSTIKYLRAHLESFPASFVQTGGTLFIHPDLYPAGLPPYMQSAFTLCGVYTHTTSRNYMMEQAIWETSKSLIQQQPAHTFTSKLAFVQALVLLQIITLFSPTSSQALKERAENRMPLLRKHMLELYYSVPAYLPASMTPYDAWVLAESCRRTLHVAHILTGVHSVLSRGCFTLTLFVEALPLERNAFLWDYSMVSSEKTKEVCPQPKADLISYRELMDMWDRGEIQEPRLLEEMLIAGCKGVDNVKNGILRSGQNSQTLFE